MSPKRVKELTEKKYRSEAGLFLVEGDKNIRELLTSDFEVRYLFGTKDFLGAHKSTIAAYEQNHKVHLEIKECTETELIKMGTLLSNNAGIAVVKQKDELTFAEILKEAHENFVIVLDDIRDPGNLGTIMRTADWYGVSHIAASETTTDVYNSKVISASMGSFTRIHVSYGDLETLLREAQLQKLPIIAAHLEGENTHTATLPHCGFLLMGSESHGVSEMALSYATHKVMIPRFGNAESLNVSVATGILLDTLKRK